MLIDERVNRWEGKSDKEIVFGEFFLLISDMTRCSLFTIDGEMAINRRQGDPLIVLLRVRTAWADFTSFFSHPVLSSTLHKVFPLS